MKLRRICLFLALAVLLFCACGTEGASPPESTPVPAEEAPAPVEDTPTSAEETPAPVEETPAPEEGSTDEAPQPDGISQDEVLDSFTGQQRIPFDD